MRSARIELLCVGSELLGGQVNTHQAYLATRLKALGLRLARECSLPDDAAAIAAELRQALGRADAVILCGGLGPTFDDVTREAAARALGLGLAFRPALYAAIKRKFTRHGLPVPEENKRQAFVLDGARVLPNRFGSAPGQLLLRPRATGLPQALVLLPGPFAELKPMFEGQILPLLRRVYARRLCAEALSVHLSGIPESAADEKLQSLTRRPGPGTDFTILASTRQVDFHATATAPTRAGARAILGGLRRRIYEAVGEHIFGEAGETLESAVGRLLLRQGLTLALAESCTGGLLGARLTEVPGSSAYFRGGVVAYANSLKTGLLGVRPATLDREGAVSGPCAAEMAEGVRRLAKASLGLSITGIAGPGGASREKPVGLVFFGLAGRGPAPEVRELRLAGGRETIRQRAASAALDWLLRRLGRP